MKNSTLPGMHGFAPQAECCYDENHLPVESGVRLYCIPYSLLSKKSATCIVRIPS